MNLTGVAARCGIVNTTRENRLLVLWRTCRGKITFWILKAIILRCYSPVLARNRATEFVGVETDNSGHEHLVESGTSLVLCRSCSSKSKSMCTIAPVLKGGSDHVIRDAVLEHGSDHCSHRVEPFQPFGGGWTCGFDSVKDTPILLQCT